MIWKVEGRNDMSLPLLLVDMMNPKKENIIRSLGQLLQGNRQDTYIVREKFFMQLLNGRVAPVLVEQQVGYMESEIGEGFQGEMSLEDFSIVLVIEATMQPDFLQSALVLGTQILN